MRGGPAHAALYADLRGAGNACRADQRPSDAAAGTRCGGVDARPRNPNFQRITLLITESF
ncbi:hypothetical protein DID96_16125 [Burkholderia sp. Bp8963]|nr:hypothetical protein DID96_16125 [Burkholderia sp. Bp8963]